MNYEFIYEYIFNIFYIGIYLVNKDKMLYSHLERQWGDEADLDQILAAIDIL